jgi:hypothetical protein
MTIEDYFRGRLVDAAWRIAGKVSFPAAVAVMFTVRNVLEKNADNNWVRAIDQVCLPRPYEEPDVRDPDFARILEVVDSVIDGTRIDNLSNDSVYLEAGEGREECANVGGFRLFKDKR